MNLFFTQTSEAVKDTLHTIKEYFEHRSVNGKVIENFKHVWNLVEVWKG